MKPLIVSERGTWTRESGEAVSITSMNVHHLRACVQKVSNRLIKVQNARLYVARDYERHATKLGADALVEIDGLLARLKDKRDELETEIASRLVTAFADNDASEDDEPAP